AELEAVVDPLHVHRVDAVEVGLRRLLDCADVRDAGAVDEDVERTEPPPQLGEGARDVVLLRDVALHVHGGATGAGDRLYGRVGGGEIDGACGSAGPTRQTQHG